MRCALFFFWLSAAIASPVMGADTKAAAAVPATSLMFELSDGSRIIGTPAITKLKMATPYAEFEIPLSMVRTVEFHDGNDLTGEVALKTGDLLNARLGVKEITVKTLFGNATIPLAQVRKIQVSAGSDNAALPEGVVLHYTFDEKDEEKVADASSSENNGEMRGGVVCSSEGKQGGAVYFSKSSQVIVAKNNRNLQMQDFTIMAWVKRDDKEPQRPPNSNLIFSYGQAGYGFGLIDGNPFLTKVGDSNVRSNNTVPNDGNYHHVAVTKEKGKVIFYIDGSAFQADTYDPGFEFDTEPGVGNRADAMESWFRGWIDEVVVFDRPLTADEVKRIYNSQK